MDLVLKGLILAAGRSSRMGDFKPLMRIGDKTLIEHTVAGMFAGGAVVVTVVLGHRAREVEAVLCTAYSPPVSIAVNPAYAETDMLASVKIGLGAIGPCDAFFLLPADMPAVAKETFFALAHVMAAQNAALVFPTVKGRRAHPPLISSKYIPEILAWTGNDGLRGLWQQYRGESAELAVDDEGCLRDANTMEDYHSLAKYMERMQII